VLYPASSGDRPDLAPAWAVELAVQLAVELALYSDGHLLHRSGWEMAVMMSVTDYCGERDVIWARWRPVSRLSSEEAWVRWWVRACVRGRAHSQGGAVRGWMAEEEGGLTAQAQEMAGGLLEVCHRQRGRGSGGQWLAVEGGRYHVQGSYKVVGSANGSGWRR
jgi:hypothetical protein